MYRHRHHDHDSLENECRCPIRALTRDVLRYSLQKKGHRAIAESLFKCTAAEDDAVITQYPAVVALKASLLSILRERADQFVELTVALRSYQGTEDETFELHKNIAQRLLSHRSNFGRVGAFIAFCGFAAAELVTKGVEFLKAVVTKIVDDVDERVYAFLVVSGKLTEVLARRSSDVSVVKTFDWTKPLHALGGVAAMAGSAFLLAAVLSKS